MTRRLYIDAPGRAQTLIEGVVQAIEAAIDALLPGRAGTVLSFVGTLWIFVALANLTGLVPGLHSPTADLSTTAALAFLVFLTAPPLAQAPRPMQARPGREAPRGAAAGLQRGAPGGDHRGHRGDPSLRRGRHP